MMKPRIATLRTRLGLLVLLVSVIGGCDKQTATKNDGSSAEEKAAAAEKPPVPLEAVDEPEAFDDFSRTSEALPNPIAYTFNAAHPYVDNYVYGVYQDAGLTLVARHETAGEPQFEERRRHNLWLAGAPFEGRLVNKYEAGRKVYVHFGAGDFEPGDRFEYKAFGKVAYRAYDQIEAKLSKGDKTREIAGRPTSEYRLDVRVREREWDGEGNEKSSKTRHYPNTLWIAEDLPYSPSFVPSLARADALFAPVGEGDIGEYVYNLTREQLSDIGLVLGVEVNEEGRDEPHATIEATDLREVEQTAYPLEWRPVMSQQAYALVSNPLLASKMVTPDDEAAIERSTFMIDYREGASGRVEGAAVYGTNDQGDFALLLRAPSTAEVDFDEVERSLFVLLLRPMHGRPGKGTHSVVDAASDLDGMSTEQLEELSEKFNAFVVLREQPPGVPEGIWYPAQRLEEGEVVVEEAGEGLSGRVSLDVEALVIGGGVHPEPANITIEGTFEAFEGLDRVGSSKITQRLEPSQ